MFGRDPDLGVNRRFPAVRVEAGRTALAGIGDLPFPTDQVQPHWQRDVAFFDAVVDRIGQHWHLQFEVDLAHGRYRGPLGVASRLSEAEVWPQILRHTPTVVRVRFPYVDDVELNPVLVVAVDFVQAHGPITNRRSSIGAEDEADGLSAQRGESNPLAGGLPLPRDDVEREIGGDRAGLRDLDLARFLFHLQGVELRLADVRDRKPHFLAFFGRHRRALHGPLLEREVAGFGHALFLSALFPYCAGILTVAGASTRPVSAASSSSIVRPRVSIAMNRKARAARTYQPAK